MCRIYISTDRFDSFSSLIKNLSAHTLLHYILIVLSIQAFYLYKSKQISLLKPLKIIGGHHCVTFLYFILYRIKLLIVFGFSDKALTLFDSLPNSIRGTIEGDIILSFIDIRNNNLSQAFSRIRIQFFVSHNMKKHKHLLVSLKFQVDQMNMLFL